MAKQLAKEKNKKYKTTNKKLTLANEQEIALLRLEKSKPPIAMDNKYTNSTAGYRRPANQLTSMEKLEMVTKGVTKADLEILKKRAGLDYDTLAKGLSTSRAALINVKGDNTFNFSVSEKIIGLEDIYSYGYEVFGDMERFNQWMFRPNKALGNQAPFDLVNNQFGREEVKNLVGRIDYGVYA